MKKPYLKWEDFPREDLKNIPVAESRGWKVCFSPSDELRSRKTISISPLDPVSFEKGNKMLWRVKHPSIEGKFVWKVADLVKIHYVNHRLYDTIEEALEKE